MGDSIKETLQKQLQLLSEHSQKPGADLPALTHAMVQVSEALKEPCNLAANNVASNF